jgi:hypothetical protein
MALKRLIHLIFVFLFVNCCVVFLFFVSKISNRGKNGFKRNFTNTNIKLLKSVDLKNTGYYFAGRSDDNIYLSNHNAASSLLTFNHSLENLDTRILRLQFDAETFSANLQVFVDSPFIYLMDGDKGKIMKAVMRDLVLKRLPLDSFIFNAGLPIGQDVFIIRAFDHERNKNVLIRLKPTLPHHQFFPDILEQQIDGVFSTDGRLHYNSSSGNIIYVHFYHNRIIGLDNNLNLMFGGHSVDTCRFARINIQTLPDKTTTLSTPPRMVNKLSYYSDDFIFINSALKADNEDINDFARNSVIDIYDSKSIKYISSFYIPRLSLKDILVVHNKLYVITDHFLLLYSIGTI